jgi:hypothetical protein
MDAQRLFQLESLKSFFFFLEKQRTICHCSTFIIFQTTNNNKNLRFAQSKFIKYKKKGAVWGFIF